MFRRRLENWLVQSEIDKRDQFIGESSTSEFQTIQFYS